MAFGIPQDVCHRRRCLFWNAWFVVIRYQKVSESTQQACEESPPDPSGFLADMVRTLEGGTLGLCRACSSVQAISSELMVLIVFFLRASAIPQNSLPISLLHILAKASSTTGLVHQFPNLLLQHQVFFSSAVVEQVLFLELFDASRQAFLCHIVFQVRFLVNTLHLQP